MGVCGRHLQAGVCHQPLGRCWAADPAAKLLPPTVDSEDKMLLGLASHVQCHTGVGA